LTRYSLQVTIRYVYKLQFLTCVSITAHIIDICWTSVRPSHCVKTAQPIVKLPSLPGSPMILVF